MKREFALLLTLCAFAAAMVPRERRAVDTEATEATTEAVKNICAPTTPCGWSFYNNPHTKIITMDIFNTYCICAEGYSCEEYEEDATVNSFIKRCKNT